MKQLCADLLNLWRLLSWEGRACWAPRARHSPQFSAPQVQLVLLLEVPQSLDGLTSRTWFACSALSFLCYDPLPKPPYFPTLTLSLSLFILLSEAFLLSFCSLSSSSLMFPRWSTFSSCWAPGPAVVRGRDITYNPQTGSSQPTVCHSKNLMSLVRTRSPNAQTCTAKITV